MVIWSSGVFFSSLRFLLLWFITRPRSVLCAPSFIRNRVNLLGNDFGEKKTNILSIDRRIMRSWLVREGGGQKKKKEKEKKKQKKKKNEFSRPRLEECRPDNVGSRNRPYFLCTWNGVRWLVASQSMVSKKKRLGRKRGKNLNGTEFRAKEPAIQK